MISDYKLNENGCVVCGEDSNYLPLCSSCYKSYKKFYNGRENLGYCNKTLRYAMLKIFAYFDLLEKEEIDEDKTGFLIDFSLQIRSLIQNQEKLWFEEEDKTLLEMLKEENAKLKQEIETYKANFNEQDISDPRKKWHAKYRCKDGHYVRSKAELIIDNWLHLENIRHIYEKQVSFPNGEKRFCDFYLPDYKAYVEFWGNIDDYYIKRKNDKIALYKSLKDINLLQLDDKSLENLDDILEEFIETLK